MSTSIVSPWVSLRSVVLALVASSGCAASESQPGGLGDGGAEAEEVDAVYPYSPPFRPDRIVNGESVPERPRDPDAGPPPTPGPTEDAGPAARCDALGAGGLRIVELMVKRSNGTGDLGEWVEIQNPNPCLLRVPEGLTVSSPRGAQVDTAVVAEAFELAPYASFLAGGSEAPSLDGSPTLRFERADVLKNSGDSVHIALADGTPIDEVTYPLFRNLEAARSISFPSDCPAEARADFQNWSGSFTPSGELTATPFSPNDDVTCER